MSRKIKETMFADLPDGVPIHEDHVDVEECEAVPDVPDVTIEDPHWKVGDGMNKKNGTPDYIIGQIALVWKQHDPSGKGRFDIVIFDTKGVERGRWSMTQD
jgi:hypothetical protein